MTTSKFLNPLIGWLMLSAVLLAIGTGFSLWPGYWSGALAWLAGVLLIPRITGLLRWQIALIGTLGLLCVLWGSWQQPLPWQRLLAANQVLVAMLLAVSFLRLVTSFRADPNEQLPLGRMAGWRTLLGVHLFGAVINMSTLVIIGERLSRRESLTPVQGMILSRGFALAAHWSPFFVAMGVALTQAPGAELSRLMLVGLPSALAALLLTQWWLGRRADASQVRGYPIHFEALWLPLLLALLVLLLHWLWPQVVILSWVSALSLGLCLVMLWLRQRRAGLGMMRAHIEQQLPAMAGELCLFLAAGLLSVGLALVVERSGFELQLSGFGPWQAWLLLLLIVAASMIGIHPLISIASAGGVLAGQVEDASLLGITFLMGWALGIMASPLSGTHLTLQARFGLPAFRLAQWNLGFVWQLLLIDLLALHGYGWLRGL
jgi:hypothetical protein